jgi:hypothetical protein
MNTRNKQLLLRSQGWGQLERVWTGDCVSIFHAVEVQMNVCWLQPGLKKPSQEQRTPRETHQWQTHTRCHGISK